MDTEERPASRLEISAARYIEADPGHYLPTHEDVVAGGITVSRTWSNFRIFGLEVRHVGYSDAVGTHIDTGPLPFEAEVLVRRFLPREVAMDLHDGGYRFRRRFQPGNPWHMHQDLIRAEDLDSYARELASQRELHRDGFHPDFGNRYMHDGWWLSLYEGHPDFTVDFPVLEQRRTLPIGLHIARAFPGDWATYGRVGLPRAIEKVIGSKMNWARISEDFEGPYASPGRIWFSVAAMAVAGAYPGTDRAGTSAWLAGVERKFSNKRIGWVGYSSTSEDKMLDLFTPDTAPAHGVGNSDAMGRNFSFLAQDEEPEEVKPWPLDCYTPIAEGVDPVHAIPVLGVKPGATGYTRFKYEAKHPYANFNRTPFNTRGDRVFIHRGTDAWRFLFAFDEDGHMESDHVPLLYCIPIVIPNSDIVHHRPKTFRGLPLAVQEAIWSIPGMSLAMARALNEVQAQLRKRRAVRPYSHDKFPPYHFVAGLGSGSLTTFANPVMPEDQRGGFFPETHYTEAKPIAGMVQHLWGLAGPHQILKPVARPEKKARAVALDGAWDEPIQSEAGAGSSSQLRILDL